MATATSVQHKGEKTVTKNFNSTTQQSFSLTFLDHIWSMFFPPFPYPARTLLFHTAQNIK